MASNERFYRSYKGYNVCIRVCDIMERSVILLDNEDSPIEVIARKSERAKRISIKISSRGVELIVPPKSSFNEASRFLLSKEHWIKAQLRRTQVAEPWYHSVSQLYIYGEPYEIVRTKSLGVIRIEGNTLLVSQSLNVKVALTAFFKATIRNDISTCAARLAHLLKVRYRKISIRDTKGQWGSCSSRGNLSFSWRLIFAPSHVMEYVVAHELCHLIERNHSSRFWALVAKIDPNYPAARLWLKKHGRELFRFL
jgi:predicted metal-dependent hydrolase